MSAPVPRASAQPRFGGDVAALERELSRAVDGEVRFGAADRALYATDASNYRQVPIGVVVPRSVDALVAAVEACRRHDAPIVHRGGGTSLAGQCCNAAVVIDGSKHLDRIVELDPQRRLARVLPGCRLDRLRDAANDHGLTFGPDPATHAWCTLGGMIGNNACGVHAQMAGRTELNVEALEVLTYDGARLRVGATTEERLDALARAGGRTGEIHARLRDLRDRHQDEIRARFSGLPRLVSGYPLAQLLPENGFHLARALVGTEGTCVTILEATVRLVPWPSARVLLVLGYADVYSAADHVPQVLEAAPLGLEGMDEELVRALYRKGLHRGAIDELPDGGGFLLVEVGGDSVEEARGKAETLRRRLERDAGAPAIRLYLDPAEQKRIWEVRESGLGATARGREGDAWPGWEDSAVPPEALGDYLRGLRGLYRRHGYRAALYGHFGQGCVHTRINFDLTSAGGIARYRRFLDDATELCVSLGGSLSGEHGDGQARGELLPRMFGERIVGAFREFKSIWDPAGRMNPGKVVDPYRLDEHLRLGTGYAPPPVRTHFAFPGDDGRFERAALRCVGVGRCRRLDMEGDASGVMCPSYVGTLEEAHSTRGRARLLFEMLNNPELDGWRDAGVHGALDLCLACKGCKRDCPVDVDMAAYKAEFHAHYYRGRLRPRAAYALGLIHWWARAGARFPRVANAALRAPGLRRLAYALADLAPERELPAFAPRTLSAWFRRRRVPAGTGRERVLLWPDTFHEHFRTGAAMAAVEVLEDAGLEVALPRGPLCCGRPLYDHGWIERARKLWARTLHALRADIRAGTPVVVLEPSCWAAFKDELLQLFPRDEDALRLSRQTWTLGALLDERGYRPPPVGGEALVHGHCHQRALAGLSAEERILRRAGVRARVVETTCCGMAGAFGFERAKYALSVRIGEDALLPAVRAAPAEVRIVADGFSCREQIGQCAGRESLHLAELLRLGLRRRGGAGEDGEGGDGGGRR